MYDFEDVTALAQCVARDGAREPEQGRAAIAWALRNRTVLAVRHVMLHGEPHPQFGDGSLKSVCFSHWKGRIWPKIRVCAGTNSLFESRDFCRAMAACCLSLCGDIADPTRGATHYHHHAQTPGWAEGMHARTLIGSHIFYQ